MAKIQLRRGTAAQWTTANPVLDSGEPAVETDTLKIKVGNGSTAWNSLSYVSGSGSDLVSDTTPQLGGDLDLNGHKVGDATAADLTKLHGAGTLSGNNTGDQTSVTGNAGTATALQTSRNIDGQAFNGTADVTVIAPGTHAATGKTTPVDADELPLADSAASYGLKKLTWSNLKATLKTYFDSLYQSTITLTTTGTSGAATFSSGTLNIPQYSAGGGGDASTNTSTSVDSEVAVFSGTAGKTLKRATGSGIAKLASGVLSTATAGTDYYAPGSTDVAVADGGTGASTALAARTNLGAQALLINSVKDYGALGDGSTDDTTAINNAIAAGGITFFPAGTYIHTGLTLPNGARLRGVGQGQFSRQAPTTQRSILKLKNSSNVDSITIPADGYYYGSIEDIEIDGNKANQTSNGIGIKFTNNTATREDEWRLTNVEVYNAKSYGIYYGFNRRAMYANRVVVTGCGNSSVYCAGSDSTWIKTIAGNNDSGNAVLVIKSVVNRFIGGDIFAATGAPGIVIDGVGHTLESMGIDHHSNDGIYLDTTADEVQVIGCIFHSNGTSTNNTYADINASNAVSGGRLSFVGNSFGAVDGTPTNKRKYAIYLNTKTAISVGNSHNSSATGTAYCDAPSQLLSDAALITVPSGGTGVATLTGIVKGNGTSAMSAATAGTDYVAPGGALGTPSSGTLTNCGSLPVSGITASTSTALGVGSVELGHASDTTLSRSSAGVLAVEGNTVPVNTTSAVHTAGTIELGHASDTTLSRSSAGVLAVEGITVSTRDTATTASSSTPTPAVTAPNFHYTVTALAAGATFGAPTGSPQDGWKLLIRVKDNGTARSLAYNAIYRAIGVTLPTTTVISKTLYLGCVYNSADTKWDVVAVGQEA